MSLTHAVQATRGSSLISSRHGPSHSCPWLGFQALPQGWKPATMLLCPGVSWKGGTRPRVSGLPSIPAWIPYEELSSKLRSYKQRINNSLLLLTGVFPPKHCRNSHWCVSGFPIYSWLHAWWSLPLGGCLNAWFVKDSTSFCETYIAH